MAKQASAGVAIDAKNRRRPPKQRQSMPKSLDELFRFRFRKHLQEIGKYGRLILNDHFSIILFVLFAFGITFYQNILSRLQASNPAEVRIPIIIISLVWLAFCFNLGQPLWYTKDPDKSYLFARGEEWTPYWLKGTLLGLIIPAICFGVGQLIVYPFISYVSAWQGGQIWFFITLSLLMKLISFLLLYLNIYDLGLGRKGSPLPQIAHTTLYTLLLLGTLVLPPGYHIGLMASAAILGLGYILWAMSQRRKRWIQFDYVVHQETLREAKFYRLVSIFADVPDQKVTVSRRQYLDWFLKQMGTLNQSRYGYLYMRVLFRNDAYAGIWLRVMIFVAVMLVFAPSPIFAVLLGAIGYILTLVQLMPLMKHYQRHPIQKIYPNRAGSQVETFRMTMTIIIGLQTAVYALVYVFAASEFVHVPWVIVSWILVAAILLMSYIPWWGRHNEI